LLAVVTRWIVLLLPRKTALDLGIFLADLVFCFPSSDKEKALENLSIAFGKERSYAELLRICHNCFRNLGKSLMEFLQFPRLTPENLGRLVSFEGRQNIDDALKIGKGVIIITSHFNNWELLAASLSLSGYKVNYIVRAVRSPRLDVLVNENRKRMGWTPIPRGPSIKSALRCLRRNEILGIAPDIDTKVDSIFVDFFGRPAFTPRGPVSIALRTGAVLVPAFIIRQQDDAHKVVVEKALKLETTGNAEEDVRLNTARCTKIIESYIRKYPEQWIWMHRRWKTRPPQENRSSPLRAR
jgi:KDO2-lipid IV(A) lauroyltransferase